jgi:hypothetical protein
MRPRPMRRGSTSMYNEEIQKKLKYLALSDQGCTGFYKNSKGLRRTFVVGGLLEAYVGS